MITPIDDIAMDWLTNTGESARRETGQQTSSRTLLVRSLAAVQALSALVRTVLRSGPARFLGHFLEMVVAMMVGMLPLGLLYVGLSPTMPVLDEPAVGALLMAIFMSVPMVTWMRLRGHTRRQAAEMSAAMVAPGVPLILLDMWGPAHLAMLLGMLALMLYRRHEYLHARHHDLSQMSDGRAQAAAEPRRGTHHATGRAWPAAGGSDR